MRLKHSVVLAGIAICLTAIPAPESARANSLGEKLKEAEIGRLRVDGGFVYISSENRDKLTGIWRFNLWRQNVQTYERKLIFSAKQAGYSINDFDVRSGRIVLTFGSSERESDGTLSQTSWFSELVPGENPLAKLLLRRIYRSDAKSTTRVCGEELNVARPTSGGGFITESSVTDEENPPAGDCPGPDRKFEDSKDWMIFRWLDRDGHSVRKIRYEILEEDGGSSVQLFADGRGVIESNFETWRVTDFRTKKSRSYSAAYSYSADTGVFVGTGRAIAAVRRIPGSGKSAEYALTYFSDPLRSRRSALVARFYTKDIRAGFCGDRFVYLDRRRTRAFTFDPETGRSKLLVDAYGLQQYWFECDARGAVFWRAFDNGDDAVPDSARYLKF